MKYQVLFSLKNNEKVHVSAAVVVGALWVKTRRKEIQLYCKLHTSNICKLI